VTDRQTYGRTDRILIARPRLHSMQRGKNALIAITRPRVVHGAKGHQTATALHCDTSILGLFKMHKTNKAAQLTEFAAVRKMEREEREGLREKGKNRGMKKVKRRGLAPSLMADKRICGR